jgi:hypothetical protein
MAKTQLFFKKLHNLLFWYVLFVFIFIPLYPKFPLFNVKGTFVAIRLEDLLIAGLLGLWILQIIFTKRLKQFLKDNLVQSLLLFFFIGLLSLISAYFITHTIKPNLGILHFLRRIEFMALLPVVADVVTKRKQVIIILLSMSAVALLVNIYAFGQQYLHWPLISTTNSEFSKGLILYLTPDARVNSSFAGHYDLAVFLVMIITVASALFFSIKNFYLKTWVILISSMSLVVLVMTAARQSFVAVLFGLITSLILTGKKLYILLILVVAVGILIYPSQLRDRLVSTFVVNFQNEGERFTPQNQNQENRSRLNIQTLSIPKIATKTAVTDKSMPVATVASDIAPGEPTDSTNLGVYRSLKIRTDVEWPRAIRAFNKNILLGTGFSSIELATDNDFLRSLGEVGLLGTITLGFVMLVILRRIHVTYKITEIKFIKFLQAGILAMALAFVLNGLFIDVFEASKIATLFWMTMGLGMAVLKNELYKK